METEDNDYVCVQFSPPDDAVSAVDNGNSATASAPAMDNSCVSRAAIPVALKLKREFDKSDVELGPPKKVICEFPCFPKHKGRYNVALDYGDEKIEQQVFISHPKWFMEPCYDTINTGTEQPWRLAIDEQKTIYFTGKLNTYSFTSLSDGAYVKPTSVKCEGVCEVRGITVDISGGVYITGDHKLQKYLNHKLVKEIGSPDPGSAMDRFNYSNGVRWHQDEVYVCDTDNQRIQVFSSDLSGRDTRSIRLQDGIYGSNPWDLDFNDNIIYVTDSYGYIYTGSCTSSSIYKRNISLKSVSVRIIQDTTKKYFCSADNGEDCLKVHTLSGKFVRNVNITSHKEASGSIHMLVEGENTPKISFIPDPLPKTKPVGLEMDSDGFLYVACSNSIQILK